MANSVEPYAYWNSSKQCWEIYINRPNGDRWEMTSVPIDIGRRMLKALDHKFVTASVENRKRVIVLIADLGYWLWNQKEIKSWANSVNIHLSIDGIVLEFDSQEDKMMFMLRWN